MCHSLLDGNGPRTNLFFQKERPLARGSLASVGAHDDLFDVDRNFSIFLFSNKRFRGCTLNQTVSASVCLFWIYTTHTICLSVTYHLDRPYHLTFPSTAQHITEQLQPKRYPSISPTSHPGITSSRASKHRRLTRLGQHHATAGPTKESHYTLNLTNTSIATYCLPKGGAILPIQPLLPDRNFSKRQSKRQRRKPSCKRLSVSSLPVLCAFALSTCPLHHPSLRPIQRGIRLSASSGKHKGASQPVSRPQHIDSSFHYRQIR